MAIKRSQNWLNQQRVDVPHLKSIESAVRNDFDEMLNALVTGEGESYIVRGFKLSITPATIGNAASALQLLVENSSLLHINSLESGTFLEVPTGTAPETLNSLTNDAVQGSFAPSSVHYIGIEFERIVDDTTQAPVAFFNPANKTEFTKSVPLAKVLKYKIVISTSLWATNVLPLATVETDGDKNVVAVEDRRPMLFRLGKAGTTTPDPYYIYPWAEGRLENPYRTTSSTSPFTGGDKQLGSLKEWMDAVMSQLQEIKGTTFWYEKASSGSTTKLRFDNSNTQMTGSGKLIHSATTAGLLNWTNDIFLDVIATRISYKLEANPTAPDITIPDGSVAYIKIVRGADITPNLIFTNGSDIVESVGGVAWNNDVEVGDYIKVAYEDDTKYYKIIDKSPDPVIPGNTNNNKVRLSEPFAEPSTPSTGVKAKYTYGVYSPLSTAPAARQIKIVPKKEVPFDEDVFWLFYRNDNGAGLARIYVRGASGGEIEQGEEKDISDNQTDNVLSYIGSPTETDTTPDYTNAIATGVAEVTDLVFPDGSAFSLVTPEYFILSSALDRRKYYVYPIIFDGTNTYDNDPYHPGAIRLPVNINTTDTAATVASKYAAAIDALLDFGATATTNSVTVTNAKIGDSSDVNVVAMPVGFSATTTTQGTGAYNFIVQDNENLTAAIKRLDQKLDDLSENLKDPVYEESIIVLSTPPTNDQQLQGPIVAGTNIKLPINTLTNAQEQYNLGEKALQVYLNGQKLSSNYDYNEVDSTHISLNYQLEIGDLLTFIKPKFSTAISGGAGGIDNGQNLGGPSDADVFAGKSTNVLQFRRLTAGSGISITQNTNDIVIQSTGAVIPTHTIYHHNSTLDFSAIVGTDIYIVDGQGSNISFNLPDVTDPNWSNKEIKVKKIDGAGTLSLVTPNNQTIDGVNATVTPFQITIQNEAITLIADPTTGGWWIL